MKPSRISSSRISSFSRSLLLLASLPVAASTVTGCHLWNHLWGKDTVSLDKADIKSMAVDIRKERKTICPREPVQMAVFVEAILDGDKEKKSVETWQGKAGSNKNDKLDFVDFAFQSDLGAFDKDGWFAPNASLLASTDKEFEIKTVFTKQPDKYSFTTKYKPDYQCIKGGGKGGSVGNGGSSGPSGQAGKDGQMGSDSQGGANGTQGGAGGPGGDGANGGAGPHVQGYATMVKTPYYDKLVAIKLSGDVEDVLLAPVDQPIVIKATGGPGGPGGSGGSGGHGGRGGHGNPAGQGGSGGQGGNGGKGGVGGAGGTIELTFDARFPELANQIHLDVSGGEGGEAGPSGHGGDGGSGGNGMTPQGGSLVPSGQKGGDGPGGAQGSAGQKGPDGRASAHAGKAADQFAGLEGITLLDGGSGVAEAQPADSKAAGKGKPGAKTTPKKKSAPGGGS
jgi:hypothetical protein